jgi:hypothetical protein
VITPDRQRVAAAPASLTYPTGESSRGMSGLPELSGNSDAILVVRGTVPSLSVVTLHLPPLRERGLEPFQEFGPFECAAARKSSRWPARAGCWHRDHKTPKTPLMADGQTDRPLSPQSCRDDQ